MKRTPVTVHEVGAIVMHEKVTDVSGLENITLVGVYIDGNIRIGAAYQSTGETPRRKFGNQLALERSVVRPLAVVPFENEPTRSDILAAVQQHVDGAKSTFYVAKQTRQRVLQREDKDTVARLAMRLRTRAEDFVRLQEISKTANAMASM